MTKGMRKYFRKKIFWFVITFIAAVILNFILPRLMPGDPVNSIVGKNISPGATQEQVQQQIIHIRRAKPGQILGCLQKADGEGNCQKIDREMILSFPDRGQQSQGQEHQNVSKQIDDGQTAKTRPQTKQTDHSLDRSAGDQIAAALRIGDPVEHEIEHQKGVNAEPCKKESFVLHLAASLCCLERSYHNREGRTREKRHKAMYCAAAQP